ncbi:hypothetical protein D3C84_575080 [compost metagenome]
MLATPVASSSRFGCGAGSSLRAKARPAAMVSVKLISAIPIAEDHRVSTIDQTGRVGAGNPIGTTPTADTPKRSRPNRLMPMMPSATAIKGAGSRGVKRFMPTSSRTMNTPTATVGSEAWPTLWTVATRLCRKPPLSM